MILRPIPDEVPRGICHRGIPGWHIVSRRGPPWYTSWVYHTGISAPDEEMGLRHCLTVTHYEYELIKGGVNCQLPRLSGQISEKRMLRVVNEIYKVIQVLKYIICARAIKRAKTLLSIV